MLAGAIEPDAPVVDDGSTGPPPQLPQRVVSHKPQMLSPRFDGSVRELLQRRIGDAYRHPRFEADVMGPLRIEPLLEMPAAQLSGGEVQRVALAVTLGTPADLYLIDEPSAYLDSEQRIAAARVIKKFVLHTHTTALVVEHDFMMATYLADRVICYEGTPSVCATARAPQPLQSGMNQFLRGLDVTFRRDPDTYRPRINKHDSVVDREQKAAGNYFFLDE